MMTPFYQSALVTLYQADCLALVKELPEASVDTVITDPPYGLGFMGKTWDCAKAGAMLFSFGGTRTWHRIACAIEDAGWEIRDTLMWLHGQGFPKSHDLAKAVAQSASLHSPDPSDPPDSPDAWRGHGTALKPAFEPIVLAMRPCDGTFAQNALKHGCAGLNISAWRIAGKPWKRHVGTGLAKTKFFTDGPRSVYDKAPHVLGRWPPNVILSHTPDCNGQCADDCPVALLDAQSGISQASDKSDHSPSHSSFLANSWKRGQGHSDLGTASRFFYCPKSDRNEREAGLDELPARTGAEAVCRKEGSDGLKSPRAGAGRTADSVRNHHPTVKPLALMGWLCRLTSQPTGGLVLDPFMGSGSTGVACVNEGRRFIGIEREPEYCEIAKRRIAHALAQLPLFNPPSNAPQSPETEALKPH